MSVKIKMYLSFVDFKENPELLYNILGVKPDVIYKKGDLIIPTKRSLKRKFNVWEIHSKMSSEQNFDKHLDSLVKQIKPKYKQFIKFSKLNRPRLNCVVEMYKKDKPSIYFSNKYIKFLSELNIDIDIDMYNY